jgi:hypothetical protein
VAIKKNIDMDQAVKFRLLFRDAGALVEIEPVSAQPAEPQNSASGTGNPEPTIPPSEPGGLSLSPVNSHDLSDCAPQITPQPIPDISSIALDKPGITLDETPAPKTLEIDTRQLSLDESGEPLHTQETEKPLEINTSGLTLSPPQEGSLEAFQAPVKARPIPNIDHLKLVEPLPETREESTQKVTGKAQYTLPED